MYICVHTCVYLCIIVHICVYLCILAYGWSIAAKLGSVRPKHIIRGSGQLQRLDYVYLEYDISRFYNFFLVMKCYVLQWYCLTLNIVLFKPVFQWYFLKRAHKSWNVWWVDQSDLLEGDISLPKSSFTLSWQPFICADTPNILNVT